MNICVHVRQAVHDNLRAGNLRGEARWERQVLEASLKNPEINSTYTSGAAWRGYGNYKGLINTNVSKDTLLLTHDFNNSVLTAQSYKAIIVNIFAGPWKEQLKEVQSLKNKYGNKFIFTIGYDSLFDTQRQYLKDFINEEDILLLPVPGCSYISEKNGFNNKILLWPYRVIVFNAIYETAAIKWALDKLIEDSTMELKIVTSWNSTEYKDLKNQEAVLIKEKLDNYFWSLPQTQQYISIRNQVEIIGSLEHHQMLDLYSKTKLVLPHYKYYGGPGVEAAMHGVPFVASSRKGAFTYCPNYLAVDSPQEQIKELQKLYTDKDYYDKIADSYKNHVKERYSYSAFNNNLNKILKDRNLI